MVDESEAMFITKRYKEKIVRIRMVNHIIPSDMQTSFKMYGGFKTIADEAAQAIVGLKPIDILTEEMTNFTQ